MGLLSELIGAGQTPDPNPYYGAQYQTPQTHPGVTQPQWVDRNGVPITDPSFTSLHPNDQQTMASMPWKNPGFFGSLGTIGRQEKLSNMEAEQYPGQQAQQINSQIQGANIIGRLPQQAQQLMAARGDLSGQGLSAWNTATANQQLGVPMAQAGALRNEALRAQAESPDAANPSISQAATLNAQSGASAAQEQLHEMPWRNALSNYGATVVNPELARRQYVEARYPGYGGPQYLAGDIGDPTNSVIGAIMNPTRTPINALTGQALSGAMGGGTLGGAPGSIVNPSWTGQGSPVSGVTAPTLAGNYHDSMAQVGPPANAPYTGNPSGPAVPPFMGPIGQSGTQQGEGEDSTKGIDINDDESFLHPYENAAFQHIEAQHKLGHSALKVQEAAAEKARQAYIQSRRSALLEQYPQLAQSPQPSTIGTIGHTLLRNNIESIPDSINNLYGMTPAGAVESRVVRPAIGRAASWLWDNLTNPQNYNNTDTQ